MTIKEFTRVTMNWYIKMIENEENCFSETEADELLNVLTQTYTSFSNLVAHKKTMGAYSVHFGEEYTEDYSDGSPELDFGDAKYGFVYIARQTNERDLYKIGMTKDLGAREKTFKVGNMFVEIFASAKSDQHGRAEKMLHKALDEYRVEGEWFKLDEDIIARMVSQLGFTLHVGLEENFTP